ncbi:APC family permease [Mycolicibacterium goodii]|uniref:APC family permease n=1 Tax=Mycolicibacterium goodii TaxID=134601 RepID=UPI001BDD6ABF|nr:APC family permease [Mycolicibacterium goodii]MBU8832872.1 APC family permease [Mycolicibacterium goodii]
MVLIVLAAAAPLTVLGGNVPLQVGSGNGIGAPIGFLVAVIVLLLFSTGFVAMTPHVTRPGAFFAYIETGIGRAAGWGAAFLALVSYSAIILGIWGFFGASMNNLVVYFGGPSVPWWIWAGVFVVVVGALGYRNVELSSRVLGFFLLAEIAIIAIFNVVVLIRGGAAGITLNSFAPSNALHGSLGIAVLFALTGFIGFESTAIYRDEAKNPDVTIPRATYIAVGTIGVFYTLSSWLMIEGWGESNAVAAAQDDPGNFMANVIGTYLGGVGQDIVQILLVTSLFACLLATHNVIARYQFTIAGRGALPSSFAQINTRHNAPSRSSLVQSITSAILIAVFAIIGLDPLTEVFGWMAGAATIGIQALMFMTCCAVVAYFVRSKRSGKIWSTRIAPILGALGLFGCITLIVANLPLMVGGTWALGLTLAGIPLVAFGFGATFGNRLAKGQDPA